MFSGKIEKEHCVFCWNHLKRISLSVLKYCALKVLSHNKWNWNSKKKLQTIFFWRRTKNVVLSRCYFYFGRQFLMMRHISFSSSWPFKIPNCWKKRKYANFYYKFSLDNTLIAETHVYFSSIIEKKKFLPSGK